ncbi:site-specific tyrosine recombinase/integron integrase [Bacillus mesophilum]|uniref:Tyrosine-type recombinase/integrase n=1 Tax=Bacillus mesophilum TaxID=1071718 RepID=A0A7V7UWT5_9BACI|nr:site-specific tyrosine recombinase/integron integrase [Bacillus mesophilum]KAB2335095.1 tyrosine-type recombinase/integrase [Bacillus mesophilum]
MVNDGARLSNDLISTICTIEPDIDLTRLSLRIEEVLANFHIERRSQKELENDLREKIELYLDARKIEGLSQLTLEGYKTELNLFANFTDKAVSHVTTVDIRKYLAYDSSLMLSTTDRKLSVLKSFFGWLVKEEILLKDPTLKINPPKKPKRLPKALSLEELEIVRDSCRSLRERALIEVMYSTACRLSEIANMRRSDISIQNMSLKVIGKGDKERTVYLSFISLHHLKKYLNSRTDDCGSLFATERRPIRKISTRYIQEIIDNIEKRANLNKKITPHVFRHTFATLAMERGADLADVQHLLGHEDPATTMIYAHVSEERKKQAHKRFHA